MPCTFCHNPAHTLTRCNASIDQFMQPYINFVGANRFELRQQHIYLCRLSKPVLTLMNYRCGSRVSGTKEFLIGNIIKLYFVGLYRANAILPSEAVSQEIELGQSNLLQWVPTRPILSIFRQEMIAILEAFHIRIFGYTVAIGMIANAMHLWDPEPVHLLNPKAHLGHLVINVTVDKTLAVQDCFMCCDDKPLAMLGCGHSYCTDCLVNTAVTRTKTFILCALCRVEVSEVKVGTEELRTTVTDRLAEE